MIMLNKIFKKNIQFSKYGRSGSIVLTKNKKIWKILQDEGWSCYLNGGIYRLNPPTLNLVDIVDIEKSLQYQNLIFNYSLYKYIEILNKKRALNRYCLKILEDEEFIQLYTKYMKLFSKPSMIKQEYIKKQNVILQENYINKYGANRYKSKDKSFKIDFNQIELEKFDYIIFILNGCFKIMSYFDIEKYMNKIIFWEIHMDETKGANNFRNIDKLKDKSVLIIDSIYSGKTMLYIKNVLKNITDKIKLLGIFPKSDSIANICDYIIILNKVIEKNKNGFNIEKEILKILGG